MDIKVKMKSKKRIVWIVSLALIMSLIVVAPLMAASRTGLQSSLIKDWHSEVDRAQCPDFLYPSHTPSIVSGQKVYQANCARCHGEPPTKDQQVISYMRAQSPEKQFERICGHKHQMNKALTIDERWDSLLYMRTNILGYYPANSQEASEMDALFGGNCAICHGTRGQGDGNLHKMLNPQPANFNMFKRLYTRSDEKLFNEISYGIPWTAMPAWKDRHDFDRQEDFNPELIWKLVRYVRSFAYSQEVDRLDIGRQKLEDYKKEIGESN